MARKDFRHQSCPHYVRNRGLQRELAAVLLERDDAEQVARLLSAERKRLEEECKGLRRQLERLQWLLKQTHTVENS
jgi:hypothetical protein